MFKSQVSFWFQSSGINKHLSNQKDNTLINLISLVRCTLVHVLWKSSACVTSCTNKYIEKREEKQAVFVLFSFSEKMYTYNYGFFFLQNIQPMYSGWFAYLNQIYI